MKKALSVISVIGLLMWTTPQSVAIAASNIAVIDLRQIATVVSQWPQQQAFLSQLESDFNSRASELQLIERRIVEKQKKLEREAAVMKSSERHTLEKEIISLGEQRAGKAQQYEQELQQRQLEAQEKIMGQIQQVAQSLAKQRGYDVVLDARVVIYSGQAKNITQEVIGILKK